MTLMLAGMVVSVVLGMLLRHHERGLRMALLLLAAGMTTMYFVFAGRLM